MWIFLLQFKFVSSCPDSPEHGEQILSFPLQQPSVHLKAFVIACLLRLSLQTDFLDL